MSHDSLRASRLGALQGARLYLVCGVRPPHHELHALIRSAVAGGVGVVQLREKDIDDTELLAIARDAAALCRELGALLVVNDRPLVAAQAGADGVHVGQEDIPVSQVREIVGAEMLLGLSTHAPAEIDAVDPSLVDYIGAGPVHATPTKLGRAAVGLELVRYAAANASVPFFAIGGIDAENIESVLRAGAERICVLRAIADAEDPEASALRLSERIADDRGAA
jgi:thiamine-phosphate pyrophosphorylase